MKICCGICSYNNPNGLKECLDTVAQKVDHTIVINTPFLGFPIQDPMIGIYSLGWISQYPNTILIHPNDPLSQIDARNLYMQESKNYDFLFVMDDDERIVVWDRDKLEAWAEDTKKKFEDKPTMFNVWLYPKIESQVPFDMPGRMFYLPERIRYLGNHYNFTIDGIHVGRSSKYSVDDKALTIRHLDPDTAQRTEEFEKNMEKYEIWQLYEEKHGNEFG